MLTKDFFNRIWDPTKYADICLKTKADSETTTNIKKD